MGRAQSLSRWQWWAVNAVAVACRRCLETLRLSVSRLDLRFPKPLEQAYLRTIGNQTVMASRRAIVLLSGIIVLKLMVDVFVGDLAGLAWMGECIVLALLAACYLVVSSEAVKYLQSTSVYVALSGFTAFIVLSSGDGSTEQTLFYGGMLAPLTLVILLMTQRLFSSALLWCACVWTLSTLYWRLGSSLVDPDQGGTLVVSELIILVSGLVAVFSLERLRREQFLTQQHGELAGFTTHELNVAQDRMCYLVALDDQLGIANRSSFDRSLRQEWRRAARYKYPLGLVLLQFDQDATTVQQMITVAQIAAGFTQRPGDLVARYESKVLALLLVDTDASQCALLARRLSEYLDKRGTRAVLPMIGFASLVPMPALFAKDLIDRAKRASDGKSSIQTRHGGVE